MHELISLTLRGASLTTFTLDGPALRVKRQGEATRWFPLRRLRQVCITGQPATGMETLLKLASKRIPVTVFSHNGELVCQLLHPDTETADLNQLLEEAQHDIALTHAREEWFEHALLRAYARVGIKKGDSRLAMQAFIETLRHQLKSLELRETHTEAVKWLLGISQTGITRLLDEKSLPLHGSLRHPLHFQLSEIAKPLVRQTAFDWVVENRFKRVTPGSLQQAFQVFQTLHLPWLAQCLQHLQTALEQASYTPTLEQRKRWHE